MAAHLLDATAILAALYGEPGHARVLEALREGAAMSAVNAAEVAAHLRLERVDPRPGVGRLRRPGHRSGALRPRNGAAQRRLRAPHEPSRPGTWRPGVPGHRPPAASPGSHRRPRVGGPEAAGGGGGRRSVTAGVGLWPSGAQVARLEEATPVPAEATPGTRAEFGDFQTLRHERRPGQSVASELRACASSGGTRVSACSARWKPGGHRGVRCRWRSGRTSSGGAAIAAARTGDAPKRFRPDPATRRSRRRPRGPEPYPPPGCHRRRSRQGGPARSGPARPRRRRRGGKASSPIRARPPGRGTASASRRFIGRNGALVNAPPRVEAVVDWGLEGHRTGPPNAPVTIVNFSDFTCPFCQTQAPVLETVRRRFGGQVAVVFRHQPSQTNDVGRRAAIAAECAARADAFEPYHDLLFRHMDSLETRSCADSGPFRSPIPFHSDH